MEVSTDGVATEQDTVHAVGQRMTNPFQTGRSQLGEKVALPGL